MSSKAIHTVHVCNILIDTKDTKKNVWKLKRRGVSIQILKLSAKLLDHCLLSNPVLVNLFNPLCT